MSKITVDQSLGAKLNGLKDEVELCDPSGRTLGFFLPPAWHHELLYAWAKAQFTDEEIEQARREIETEGGLTTREAIAYLTEIIRSRPAS